MINFREIVKKQEFYLFEDAGENLGNILFAGHYIKETYRDGSHSWFYVTKRDNFYDRQPLELLNKDKTEYLDRLQRKYLEETYGEGSEFIAKSNNSSTPSKNNYIPECIELIKEGTILSAIRFYSDQTGVGLRDAKRFIDDLREKIKSNNIDKISNTTYD